ncbi:phosphatidylglycerophosphatase A [Parahaliea mediterranea]|uniref:phosphatidylglycerophosphatase A family protein n=1 Tax=Parahaliea mediterranea TaxID=651086 RepID=UPI000E2F993D|nr:phosphatidylglycerophosphatase A [Parahaliea mediterranea]
MSRPNLKSPVHCLAFGFGSGLAPKAPGTFGTLAAVPFYLLAAQLDLAAYLVFLLLAFVLGVYVCDRASRDLGVHDHPGIVWDEFVGYWITLCAAPAGWWWVVAGFVLFRVFDILKPWPIGWLDRRVHGGLGIMLDDVVAGVMAWACLQGLAQLLG